MPGTAESPESGDRFDVVLVEAPPEDQPPLAVPVGDRLQRVPRHAADILREAVTKADQGIGYGDAVRLLRATPAIIATDVTPSVAEGVARHLSDAGAVVELVPAAGSVVLDPRPGLQQRAERRPDLTPILDALGELEIRGRRRAHLTADEQAELFAGLRDGGGPPESLVQRAADPAADEVIDALVDAYEEGDADTRAFLGDTVAQLRHVLWRVNGHAGRARRQLTETGDPRALRRALAAVGLADLKPDFRDTYLQLGSLWLAAVEAGIDPDAAFAAAASRSSTDAARFLAAFPHSPFFAESVAPHLEPGR